MNKCKCGKEKCDHTYYEIDFDPEKLLITVDCSYLKKFKVVILGSTEARK